MPNQFTNPQPAICTVDGCDRKAISRGWCTMHWQRWRKNGDPTKRVLLRGEDPAIRFWAKVNKSGTIPTHAPELGECWEWTDYLDRDGYGQFWLNATNIRAHHFSAGKPPKGLQWDHLCRNECCVRPSHLEAVTTAENVRRMQLLRRHTCTVEGCSAPAHGVGLCAKHYQRQRRASGLR